MRQKINSQTTANSLIRVVFFGAFVLLLLPQCERQSKNPHAAGGVSEITTIEVMLVIHPSDDDDERPPSILFLEELTKRQIPYKFLGLSTMAGNDFVMLAVNDELGLKGVADAAEEPAFKGKVYIERTPNE